MGAGVNDLAQEHEPGAIGATTQVACCSVGEGGNRGHLALTEGALDEGDGMIGGCAPGQEFLGQSLKGASGHEDDEGTPEGGQLRPVQSLVQQVMTLQDTQLTAHTSVSQRNARGRSRALEGTHTGNDLERDATGFEDLGLLPASSVEQGVATLEAHHPLPWLGVPQQQLVDEGLGRAAAATLAHGDRLGACGEERPEGWFQQRIVQDDIRTLQGS